MIKKISIEELSVGMFLCGLETPGSKTPSYFNNTIRIKSNEDLAPFKTDAYSAAYIEVVDEPKAPVVRPARVSYYAPSEQAQEGKAPQPHAAATEPPKTAEVKAPVAIEEEPLAPIEATDMADEMAETTEPAIVEEAPESLTDAPLAAASTAPADVRGDIGMRVAQGATTEGEDINRPDPVHFDEEVKKAREIKSRANEIVKGFMLSIQSGKGLPTEAIDNVHATVDGFVSSIFRNRDALTSLARLKSFDDYTFVHSVNVSILAISIGRHMGLSKIDLHDLGAGALLHDIGKMCVEGQILNKPGPLTEPEFAVMKRHTVFGAEIIESVKEVKDSSKCAVLQHHEKYNGTGYPGSIPGSDIHLFARITCVADVYDAMTSRRVYQNGIAQEDALKKLYFMRATHFEPQMVDRLIKCIGVYPVGSLIELSTGEIAVVRRLNRTTPLKPEVVVLMDNARVRLNTPYPLDLSAEERWVSSFHDPEKLGVRIDESLLA